MTKVELIQFFRAYVQAEEQVTDVEHEKLYLEVQIKKRKEVPRVNKAPGSTYAFAGVASSLIVGIFTIPIMAIIFLFTPFDEFLLNLLSSVSLAVNHPFITRILLAYFVPVILMLPLWCFVCNTSKEDKEKDIAAMEQYQKGLMQIPDLERKLQQIPSKMQSAQTQVQRLRNMNIVHPKYLPYSRTLLSYFEEGRADTLKEALNLFEHERREDARDEELENHYREMERQAAAQTTALADIQDETSRAADAAQQAAAWGAATTIIVASEVERQRKKDRSQ